MLILWVFGDSFFHILKGREEYQLLTSSVMVSSAKVSLENKSRVVLFYYIN